MRARCDWKNRVFARGWARYDLACHGSFRLVPPVDRQADLARDYAAMRPMFMTGRRALTCCCENWGTRKMSSISARALFFEPSQSCNAPGLSCPIRVTIAIATSTRSPDSTHWGCHSTTPAVRLTPGKAKTACQNKVAALCSPLPVRFSPAAEPVTCARLLTCDTPVWAIRRRGG
jgi:hypothetical protein